MIVLWNNNWLSRRFSSVETRTFCSTFLGCSVLDTPHVLFIIFFMVAFCSFCLFNNVLFPPPFQQLLRRWSTRLHFPTIYRQLPVVNSSQKDISYLNIWSSKNQLGPIWTGKNGFANFSFSQRYCIWSQFFLYIQRFSNF